MRTAASVLIILGMMTQTFAAEGVLKQGGASGAQGEAQADKKAQLKQLVELLKSFSDEDYNKARGEMPQEASGRPETASRSGVLSSAYTTLAALEYRAAAEAAPAKAEPRYSEAYEKVVRKAPKSVAVDPKTKKTKHWAVGLFKWLATSALKYALYSGILVVGREIQGDSEAARLDQSLEGMERELAGAEVVPEKKADIHYRMGAVYEQLAAAAAAPESRQDRAAKKKERLRELADLLQTLSDDEYQDALKQSRVPKAGNPELASRSGVLKAAYVTLAALEYRQAAKQAPQEAGIRYSRDLERLSRDEASSLAVDPETLQETGWAANLFGIAALGGIGYLVYDNQQRQRRKGGQPAPVRPTSPAAPTPEPSTCPEGTRSVDGSCVSDEDASCPEGTRRTGNHCKPVETCPEGTRLTGNHCMEIKPPRCGGKDPKDDADCDGRVYVGRVIDLYRSLDGLEVRLADAAVRPEEDAEIRHRMGSVYEQLAAAAAEPAAAPGPEAAAEPEAAPGETAEPAADDDIKRDVKAMDKTGREMQREVERRRRRPGQ